MHLRGIFILALSFPLSACSLYQSDGRKALEKNAAGLASAQSYMTACEWSLPSQEYLLVSSNEDADVYASEREEFSMAVVPSDAPYSCNYRFHSAQEMIELTDSAVEITLQSYGMAQRPGAFAFPTHSPLK
jgi:hypothetical protein